LKTPPAMKTSHALTSHALDLAIVAAGLASLVACAAPQMARHASTHTAPALISVPEQTIYGDLPAVAPVVTAAVAPVVTAAVVIYDHTPVMPRKFVGSKPAPGYVPAPTDAAHIARLMSATPEMVSCAGCT